MSTATSTNTDKRKKRTTAIKFTLAAIALTGIGAAATSAAWTDDAWFSASASAATVELQGSLSSTGGFGDADDLASAIIIPASTLANLTPNKVVTVDVWVKNTSSVALSVAPTLTGNAPVSGTNIFAGTNPLVNFVATTTDTVTPLNAGATAKYTVTVTAPNWGSSATDLAYQGATGTLAIRFTGTTAP